MAIKDQTSNKKSNNSSVAKAVQKKKAKSPKNKPGSSLTAALERAAKRKAMLNEKKKEVAAKAVDGNTVGQRKALRIQQNRSVAIHSHIKSSGKKNQAKRDGR